MQDGNERKEEKDSQVEDTPPYDPVRDVEQQIDRALTGDDQDASKENK